jgi:hypothetical protein
MVMFFLGMCREAGIPVKDAPRERQQQTATRRPSGGRATSPKVVKAPPGAVPKFEQPRDGRGGGGGSAFFGLTEEDMSNLSDDEFGEVWTALGKVAQARFRATRKAQEVTEIGPEDVTIESPEADEEDS